MRITNRSSYGVRAMISLTALYKAGAPVPIDRLAKKEGISRVFLEQIFNRLKKQDIVKSIRGPKGGYELSKNPALISVYDVVKALENHISPVKCKARAKESKMCKRASRCASKIVWDEVDEQIKKTLSKYSLKDLAVRAKKLSMNKAE